MSINGTSHVSVREFAIRTGNDGHAHAGRIHTPDPAAVANLKRILAQQAQTRPRLQSQQDARVAAILKRAKEKKRNPPERPEEKELPKMNKHDASKLITAEMVAGWAERIRAGESRNQVAKNNELGVSDYMSYIKTS